MGRNATMETTHAPTTGSPPELARRPSGLAKSNGASPVAVSETAWCPRRELELADWVRQGRWLGTIGRAVGWWLGDWIRYGNARYGEKYTAAARLTGYDVQSLMNMAYVASRFEISRRRENLSFSHHTELAGLPPEEQELWLDRAEAAGMSVHALRQERRRVLRALSEGRRRPKLAATTGPADLGRQIASESSAVACPKCGHRFDAGDRLG